jgi:hypothetical protein
MVGDIEHFFRYLLAICISSSENYPLNSFTHLLIGLFVLLLFSFLNSLYILDINPLSVEKLLRIFSHPVGFLLVLVIVSFDVKKLLNLIQSRLLILALIFWAIWVLFRNNYLCLYFPVFSLYFPLVCQYFRSYIEIFDPFGVDFHTE